MSLIKRFDNWLIKSHDENETRWKIARDDVVRAERNTFLLIPPALAAVAVCSALPVDDTISGLAAVGAYMVFLVVMFYQFLKVDRKVKDYLRYSGEDKREAL